MNNNPEEFLKQKRLMQVYLGIALIIQVIVLCLYYFVEKQSILAFPMLLGILTTAVCLVNLINWGKR